MRDIERKVMAPLKSKSWSASGLKKKTGDLQKSVKTFSGKKSAGAGLKATGLVAARAVLHDRGAKKNQYRRKQRVQIRAHNRQGRNVSAHSRKNNGSPRGNIKKRQFVPKKLSGGDQQKIINIMEQYIVQSG